MPEILAEVEAAALFLFIFEGSVPVPGPLRLPVVREEELGEIPVRLDANASAARIVLDLDAPIEIPVLVREGVQVPERDEGPHLEADRARVAAALLQPPRHTHGVLPVREEDLLLDDDAVHVPGEGRERVRGEAGEVSETFGVDRAGEAVRREVDPPAAEDERLLQLREEEKAAERRLRRRDEEAVIPARVLAGRRRHRVTAEPVRFEPLADVTGPCGHAVTFSPEEDRQQDAEAEDEEPERGGGRAGGARAALLAGGVPRIEEEPARLPRLHRDEDDCRDGSEDEVADEARQERRRRRGPPVDLARAQEREERERSDVPPDDPEHETPREATPEPQPLAPEEEAPEDAEEGAREEVEDETA